MDLAIFDLDNTLLGGDSDYLWGHFLSEAGYVDGVSYRRRHDDYYRDYRRGCLDIEDFCRFQFQVLANNDIVTLRRLRARFIEEKIRPVVLPRAVELVESHRDQGCELLIITATNSFLTEPIAALFGIDNLIATEPEFIDGRYTGKLNGVPAFAEGKVIRYRRWLLERGCFPAISWFYSDSHNDLHLLSEVTRPVAVDPDETLRGEAQKRDWPIISLR